MRWRAQPWLSSGAPRLLLAPDLLETFKLAGLPAVPRRISMLELAVLASAALRLRFPIAETFCALFVEVVAAVAERAVLAADAPGAPLCAEDGVLLGEVAVAVAALVAAAARGVQKVVAVFQGIGRGHGRAFSAQKSGGAACGCAGHCERRSGAWPRRYAPGRPPFIFTARSPRMSTPAKRRLMKDLAALSKHSDDTVFAQPLEDDMLTWIAVLIGPEGTPFARGTFSLVLVFDESYPSRPPEVSFISELFHPNVYANGDLCLDILRSRWTPSYDVLGILLSIQSLLGDPNTSSPANIEAARLFEEDTAEYTRRVTHCVEKSWVDIDTLLSDLKR